MPKIPEATYVTMMHIWERRTARGSEARSLFQSTLLNYNE